MTTVNFKTIPNGKVVITAYRSDIGNRLKGDDLIDVLETVKKAIGECVECVRNGEEI